MCLTTCHRHLDKDRLAQGLGLHGHSIVNEKAPDDASSLPAGSPAAIEFCLGLTDQGHITAPDLEFDALPLITFFRRPVTFCDHCIRVFLSQGTELQQRTEAVLIGRGARW